MDFTGSLNRKEKKIKAHLCPEFPSESSESLSPSLSPALLSFCAVFFSGKLSPQGSFYHPSSWRPQDKNTLFPKVLAEIPFAQSWATCSSLKQGSRSAQPKTHALRRGKGGFQKKRFFAWLDSKFLKIRGFHNSSASSLVWNTPLVNVLCIFP